MDAPRKGPRPPRNHGNNVVEESLTFSGIGKITVQTQSGIIDTFIVDFDKEYTDNLKGMIADKYHLDKRDYNLISARGVMDDNEKLSHYGLRDGSKVMLVVKVRSGLRGGKKRKTRKTSNKRKTRNRRD